MVSYVCKVLLLIFLSDWITNVATEYRLHIYTADNLGAGTDASVYIKLYGERANLPETLIDPPGDSFERDNHDTLILRTDVDLGILSRIEVKRDSRGWSPDWDLDRMEVDDLKTNVKYVFNCNCEIDKAHRWYKITVKKPFSCIGSEYQLVNDKCEYLETCQKGDTCKDPNAKCTYIYGRYGCRCNPGYTYNSRDKKCKDVDECDLRNVNNCEQECLNSPGSFKCGCRKGYTLKGDYKCEDVDECKDEALNECKNPARCSNEPGSYGCICPNGYEKEGEFSCKNKNECRDDPNICDYKTSVRCIDLTPGYKCECKPGFYNEKDYLCKDVDECQTGQACNLTMSTCVNSVGSFRCECLPGYIPVDDKTCTPQTCVPLGVPKGAMFVQARCTQDNANYFKDVCTLKCLPGYEAVNPADTQLTCGADSLWQGTHLICKPFECQSIGVLNNGIIRPQSCSSQSGVEQGQRCYFYCDNGYKRNGADTIKCMDNRKWSNAPPTCDKVVSSLWIKCPADIYVDLKPGKSSADVSSLWEIPQTSAGDNYITSSHKKTDRFPAGVNVVTWSVSNNNVTFKTCSLKIDVRDKEKPVAVNCPKRDIYIRTKKDKELVKLPNVEFTDNIGVKSVSYSHPNPIEIKTGQVQDIIISARDNAGNVGHCRVRVEVDSPVCGSLAPAVNGTDLQCFETPDLLCIVNCVGNKVLFNATGNFDERYWMCQNREWSPSYKIPDCVDYVDPKGSPCPSGKVLFKTTLPDARGVFEVCGDCPTGTYYDNNECKLCPPGTYQDTTGKSGAAACVNCPHGTSTKTGATSISACQAVCHPGFFSTDGFQPCDLCKPGEYQSNYQSSSCNRCPSARGCTPHKGASSLQNCGPCPSISRIEPSGNVRRVRGSVLQLSCYVDTKESYHMIWVYNMDASVQTSPGGRVYQKQLFDDDGKQIIGIQLTVRDLQASANYKCVLETMYGMAEKAVHVAVVDSDSSGAGPQGDEEESLYEKELWQF